MTKGKKSKLIYLKFKYSVWRLVMRLQGKNSLKLNALKNEVQAN